jgi:hypothetical protein
MGLVKTKVAAFPFDGTGPIKKSAPGKIKNRKNDK